jgi:hypothetical protein
MLRFLSHALVLAIMLNIPIASRGSMVGDVEVRLNGGANAAFTGQTNVVEIWLMNDEALKALELTLEIECDRDYEIDTLYGQNGLQSEGDAVGIWDLGSSVNPHIDGISPDSISWGGTVLFSDGMPAHNEHALCYTMRFYIPSSALPQADGFRLRPWRNGYTSEDWWFVDSYNAYIPDFQGDPVSVFMDWVIASTASFDIVAGCCGQYTDPSGITGNANCSTDGKVTLSDITQLINRVYTDKLPLCCEASGNTNGSPDCKITLSDITVLIDAVYVSKADPEDCMPECET